MEMAVPHMKRNVTLLALCQGYAQTSVTVIISVSALAALTIIEDKSLATLPHAFMWLATALAATPADDGPAIRLELRIGAFVH